MPGKSKKGGGLETKKSSFYLKSGNTTPFKQMGSSPAKQDYTQALEHHKKFVQKKAKKKAIKTVTKKALSRMIPYAGWALLASDIYGVGKKIKSGKSLKQSLKSQFLGTD